MTGAAGVAQAPVLLRFLFFLRAGTFLAAGCPTEGFEGDSAFRFMADRVGA